MKKTIKVIAYLVDHQDGGGSTTIYPDLAALQKDQGFDDEKMQEIIDEDDPYENGEIDETTIEVEEDENGNLRLAKEIRVSWGQ